MTADNPRFSDVNVRDLQIEKLNRDLTAANDKLRQAQAEREQKMECGHFKSCLHEAPVQKTRNQTEMRCEACAAAEFREFQITALPQSEPYKRVKAPILAELDEAKRTVAATRERLEAAEKDSARIDFLESHGLNVLAPDQDSLNFNVGRIDQRGSQLIQLRKSDKTGLYWERVTWREALDEALAAFKGDKP